MNLLRREYIILAILTSSLNAEPIVTTQMLFENIGKSLSTVGESTASAVRVMTNTRTPKEKCNTAWWDYFKYSSKIISDTAIENTKISREKRINYGSF